jgi:dihydroorotase
MAPPLRSKADADAVLAGLIDGTLDVIATDHAPHAPEKKAREFDQCPNGILGVETLLPLCITHLIDTGRLTWPRLIEKVTANPARILSIDRGTLKPGAHADVTIIDPNLEWTIDANQFQSKSRNGPFHGWKVRGRAETVIVGGAIKKPSRNHSGKVGET